MSRRRLIQPAFRHDNLRGYGSIMVERAHSALVRWTRRPRIDLVQEFTGLTLEIAARTMFGVDNLSDTSALAQAVDVSQNFLFEKQTSALRLPDWIPTPLHIRYKRAVHVMDRLVYAIIDRRRHATDEFADLLSVLLRARDDSGAGLDDQALRDEILTLLLAGHETTANALSWTTYLLSAHPEIEARLLDELTEVLDGRSPGLEDLSRLPFTERVVSESLRLYPPAWIVPRLAAREDELPTGSTIPEGDAVVVSPWSIQRDSRFFPEPNRFDPDRFLPEVRKDRPAYSYLPFGGGSRRCVGEQFAKMELALVIATILPRVEFTLAIDQRIEPEPRVTLRPRYGILARVTSRDGTLPVAG